MRGVRVHWKPRFYELFVIANFLAVLVLMGGNASGVVGSLPWIFLTMGLSFVSHAVIGVVVRLGIGAFTGTWRGYLAIMKRPAWLAETVRLLVFSTLAVHVYCWIKISVPLLHPHLMDQTLWEIDRAMCFGISPNIFALNLFSNPHVLRFVDITYGGLFLKSLAIALGYFLSAPSNRLRVAFATSNVVMWTIGAWLYLIIPSLGPAYRFPDIWFQYTHVLTETQQLQAVLWRNYIDVLKLQLPGARQTAVNLLYGIAAFPSLHVGMQTLVFLWFRRLWTWGEVIFAVFVLVISFGALITGWHYLIDVVGGIALAWASWAGAARGFKILRWVRLRKIL